MVDVLHHISIKNSSQTIPWGLGNPSIKFHTKHIYQSNGHGHTMDATDVHASKTLINRS